MMDLACWAGILTGGERMGRAAADDRFACLCSLLLAALFVDDVVGVPVRPVFIVLRFSYSPWAAAARRNAAARSAGEVNAVPLPSMRPGARAVTSCSSQPLPSGSLNEAYER